MKNHDVFPGSAKLVDGPIPASSLLLVGPTGVGKTIFCKQFAFSGLIKCEPCIYVATSESPQEIEKSMKSFGFEVESYRANGIFRIVDSYSWKSGEASSSNWTITNPGDLAVVSKTIENAIRGLINIRLVFDSITGLTSTCSYNLSFFSKFLEILVAKIKALNGNAIFIVAPEAHDQQFVNCMRQIFDGTLEMKEDESGKEMKRLLRLFSLKGAPHKTQWTPFEITSHGIVVRSETELRCMMCSRLIEEEPHYDTVGGNKLSFDSAECAQTYKKLKSIYGENFQ